MTVSVITHTKQVPQAAGLARVGIGVGLGLLSAVLLILAFQPNSIWPLAFIALVPGEVAAQAIMPRRWAGVPTGIGWGVFLLIVLTELFGLNLQLWIFPAIALLITLINLLTVPGSRLFQEKTNYRWYVLYGAVNVVGIEMIRSFIPPINTHMFFVQTAYTQPWLLQPIAIFSMYGLSLVIVLVNYAIAGAILAWIDQKGYRADIPVTSLRRSLAWLSGVAVILAAWSIIGLVSLATAPRNSPTVRVAAIQHGFMKPGHIDLSTQDARLQVLSEQTRAAAAQGAKLMVWPELGLGFDPQVAHTAELKALAAETGAYLLIGYGIDDSRGWRNEAVLLTPAGEFLPAYGKNHASSPGEPPIVTAGVYPVYDTAFGKIATIICNDVNYTDSSRILAGNGAQLITVPTYEVSAPGIHFEQPIQTVLRAVENRVATIKADTAFSAVIVDPYGRILARRDGAPNGEAFALVADVPFGTGNMPTVRLGDWVGWLALAGFVFFSVFESVKTRAGKEEKQAFTEREGRK